MNAIQRIDAEIGKLEAQIAGLRHARQLLDGPHGTVEVYTEPTAKKPNPPADNQPTEGTKPAGAKPAGAKPATGTAAFYAANREKRRHELARYLIPGPAPFGELERKIGVQPVTLRMDLDCPYFQKVNPNHRLSPWTLTESGKKFAESVGPG